MVFSTSASFCISCVGISVCFLSLLITISFFPCPSVCRSFSALQQWSCSTLDSSHLPSEALSLSCPRKVKSTASTSNRHRTCQQEAWMLATPHKPLNETTFCPVRTCAFNLNNGSKNIACVQHLMGGFLTTTMSYFLHG